MGTVVEARNVTKSYLRGPNVIHALRGVDFAVRKGEYVGVMGTSGSGKSTLMHVLGGLDRPTTGRCLVGGIDLSLLSDQQLSALRAKRIGFIFQAFHLIPQYSVLENVAMPFLYRSVGRSRALEQAARAIERVGLHARRDHRPAELSGGEMQRAAVARALAGEPMLILADEPTGNLDSRTSESICDLFNEISALGNTVIVVTHDEAVARHCGRIVRISDGYIEGDELLS